jgi:hypothetical protein
LPRWTPTSWSLPAKVLMKYAELWSPQRDPIICSLQRLVDWRGTEKTVPRLILDKIVDAGIEEVCQVIRLGDPETNQKAGGDFVASRLPQLFLAFADDRQLEDSREIVGGSPGPYPRVSRHDYAASPSFGRGKCSSSLGAAGGRLEPEHLTQTSTMQTIQLAEFCRCLQVTPRLVRYVLERGFVPEGVAKHPETGNHRRFSAQQAFWLVLVKRSGITTSLAAQIADCAM